MTPTKEQIIERAKELWFEDRLRREEAKTKTTTNRKLTSYGVFRCRTTMAFRNSYSLKPTKVNSMRTIKAIGKASNCLPVNIKGVRITLPLIDLGKNNHCK